MSYTKVGWENEPSRSTPINAQNLDKMDSAIKDHDERLDTAESNITTLQGNVSNIGTTLASTNGRVSTAESNIANLSSAMGTANGNITNLQGRMTTAEGDIDTLEGAVFSERKVYTERFATNITGNGRLMLMVSTWKKDTACVNVRFSNRVTGGFTDVVLMLKQNSYYTKCKQMYNDGIGISKIYRGSNNTTFDFEIPTSTNNAYDVYVTAPVWVSGTYGAQTSLSGTEMTIGRFDYDEMELTVGNLNNLSTTTHANIVAAINEVNGRIVDTDYAITEYSVPYVSGSNAIFMIRSNEVAVVGDEEYLLNVEVIDANGNAAEMLFLTTDDSVLNNKVVINQRSQTSNFEAIPISKVEDASSFISGNNAVLWVTLEGTPDVTVRLTHHKSKTYTVLASPAMPSGTGRTINFVNGNTELYSTKNGSVTNYVSTKNGSVAIVSTADATYDIAIINEGGQNPDIRVFTLQGDVNINGNYVGKTSLSGIGDGTITGAIAFSEEDGEEVSGEVITVTDAIDANAVDVSVDIEPVQEGSGTPSPINVRPIRAATESKNLWNEDYTGISSNVTYKAVNVGNGTFTLSSTIPLSGSGNTANLFFLAGNVSTGASTATNGVSNGIPRTVDAVNGYVTVAYRTQGTTPAEYRTQLEKGTTATPYEPYHEPQIEIQRVGKNLFDKNDSNSILNAFINAGAISASTNARTVFVKCEANTQYAVSKTAGARFTVGYTTELPQAGVTVNGSVVDHTASSISITTGANAKYLVAFVYNSSVDSGTAETMLGSVQIEKSNQATTYESYQGETYIIKTGQNIYGAHHDATTGKMVVTHGIAEFDGSSDESWSAHQSLASWFFIDNALPNAFYDNSKNNFIKANEYTQNTYNNVTSLSNGEFAFGLSGTNKRLVVKDTRYTTISDFKSYLINNPLQLVYELAEPQTINLTPQQIKMLKGTNTLSSNAQTLNLTYLKDNAVGKAVSIVEKEIEPQIEEIHNELNTKLNSDSIAPVENGDTASTSYAVGNYITRNNSLYKVISAIASGASFTDNNIQRTTLTDIIKHKTVYYTNNTQTNDLFIPLFSSSEANRKGIVSVMLLDAYSMIPAYATVAGQVEYGGGGSSSLSASISYHLKIASGQGIFNTGSYSVEVFYVEF